MNRLSRLARFERIFERTKRPSKETFWRMFEGVGFTRLEFDLWAFDRRWT
jgi:hypothetical protein